MNAEELDYRDYQLVVVRLTSMMWQVSIYATQPWLPSPSPVFQHVISASKQEAMAEAERHVDELLSQTKVFWSGSARGLEPCQGE